MNILRKQNEPWRPSRTIFDRLKIDGKWVSREVQCDYNHVSTGFPGPLFVGLGPQIQYRSIHFRSMPPCNNGTETVVKQHEHCTRTHNYAAHGAPYTVL